MSDAKCKLPGCDQPATDGSFCSVGHGLLYLKLQADTAFDRDRERAIEAKRRRLERERKRQERAAEAIRDRRRTKERAAYRYAARQALMR
jgi:hypothetical protein